VSSVWSRACMREYSAAPRRTDTFALSSVSQAPREAASARWSPPPSQQGESRAPRHMLCALSCAGADARARARAPPRVRFGERDSVSVAVA
jgi:hypothetical protein